MQNKSYSKHVEALAAKAHPKVHPNHSQLPQLMPWMTGPHEQPDGERTLGVLGGQVAKAPLKELLSKYLERSEPRRLWGCREPGRPQRVYLFAAFCAAFLPF